MNQGKSAEQCSQAGRLQTLRLKRQMTWAQLAEELKLSESMLYQVVNGAKTLSQKALWRLKEIEVACGLTTEEKAILEDDNLKNVQKSAVGALKKIREGLNELIEILENLR